MLNFKLWINESFTDNSEKLNQIAKRIWANVTAQINQAVTQKEDFKNFQMWAIGKGMHQAAVYDWLTQRMGGKEEETPENAQQITDMANQMANAPTPTEAVYTKGAGWHHWIINNDMARGASGTDKTYISVYYKTLLPQAQTVMTDILKNLVLQGYKGQIKIAAAPEGWLKRMDNIVLHSGSPEWAQFGANITKSVLEKFQVKLGGTATTGNMEQGLDPKGTGTSFNGFVSEQAANDISQILKNTADYQHFSRNIQNHFQSNGPFVQKLQNILK